MGVDLAADFEGEAEEGGRRGCWVHLVVGVMVRGCDGWGRPRSSIGKSTAR